MHQKAQAKRVPADDCWEGRAGLRTAHVRSDCQPRLKRQTPGGTFWGLAPLGSFRFAKFTSSQGSHEVRGGDWWWLLSFLIQCAHGGNFHSRSRNNWHTLSTVQLSHSQPRTPGTPCYPVPWKDSWAIAGGFNNLRVRGGHCGGIQTQLQPTAQPILCQAHSTANSSRCLQGKRI